MRFIDLLDNNATWLASYRDTHIDARYTRVLLNRLAEGPVSDLSRDKLHVFCVYTPLEALLAYFIASRFGLLVAIVSPRGLAKLLDGLDPNQLGPLILPMGHKQPMESWAGQTLWLDLKNPGEATDSRLTPAEQPARFVFSTSGTTGKAKRVVHRETSLVGNAQVVVDYLKLGKDDLSYCVFPLQFMYGLSTTLCSLLSGGKIHYSEFVKPAHVASYVVQNSVTVLPLLGEWSAELRQVWSQAGFSPTRLVLLNASDRLLLTQAEELLPFATEFWNNLGQTESAPRLFAVELVTSPGLEAVSHNGVIAAGSPVHPDITLILDLQEKDVGVLHYRTPFVMEGYLQDDGSLTRPDEWINSGDLFRQGEDKLWYWLGRISHTIKINGELVPLSNITSSLLTHKDVTGVAYITNKLGELCAFVESKRDCSIFHNELADMVMNALRGKRSKIQLVPSLPRTENGKIDFSTLIQSHSDAIPQHQALTH